MVFRNEKTAKFLQRSLTMIPTAYEKYDANHISLVFFGSLGLTILGCPVPREVADFVDGLWVGNGYKGSYSYAGAPDGATSAHLPSTYFCLGIRRMLDMPPLPQHEVAAIRAFIPTCQLPNGLFRATAGGGEASIRHTYTAHAIHRLLNDMDRSHGETPSWIDSSLRYIINCQNYEGGMGDAPEEESHLGLTYCAVASLAMQDRLSAIPHRDLLAAFVAKRQTPSGGHNGRPNKPADVCYSFWALGTQHCLDTLPSARSRAETVAFLTTTGFDDMLGGFWKTPGTHADPYHTALALCALSLLDADQLRLRRLDPVLCLPVM